MSKTLGEIINIKQTLIQEKLSLCTKYEQAFREDRIGLMSYLDGRLIEINKQLAKIEDELTQKLQTL